MSGGPLLVTSVGSAGGSEGAAAALAGSGPAGTGLLIVVGGARRPRPGLVAAEDSRRLEERLAGHIAGAAVAARGALCLLSIRNEEGWLEQLRGALAVGRDALAVVHLPATLFRAAIEGLRTPPAGVLLVADLGSDRAQTGLAAGQLARQGIAVAVLRRPPGRIATLRALAGLQGERAPLPDAVLARLASRVAS